MKKLFAVAALGMAFALPACSGSDEAADDAAMAGADADGGMAADGTAGATAAGATTASAWPEGSRIEDEDGVSYRVDAAGTRVRLGSGDSRIVMEGGTRYRVDPDGTRVEIDERGAALRIGDSVITGNAPNGASDVETPGEAVTDAAEDAVEAVGDVVD